MAFKEHDRSISKRLFQTMTSLHPHRQWQCFALCMLWWLQSSVAFAPSQQSPAIRTDTITARAAAAQESAAIINSLPQEIERLMLDYDPILLYVSRLLDKQTAADAGALYAWCRRLDEITDNNNPNASREDIRSQLQDWQDRFDQLCDGKPVDAMDNALYECLQRHQSGMGKEPFDDMIKGMQADTVEDRRIGTMAELEEYGYQVAGTVGLMLLPLLNADTTKAREPAIALGQAIQLINILRDATPDAALGRIYLPQDMLQEQNVKEEDIIALECSKGYQKVVREVAARSEALLQEAERGKQSLPGFGPLLVQIIIELYRGYLEQLEKLDYNNLLPNRERVRISTTRKVLSSWNALRKVLWGL